MWFKNKMRLPYINAWEQRTRNPSCLVDNRFYYFARSCLLFKLRSTLYHHGYPKHRGYHGSDKGGY